MRTLPKPYHFAIGAVWFYFSLAGTLYAAIPAAPSNLDVRLLPDQIHVVWQDHSSNETGFLLQRKVDSGSWANLVYLNKNTTSYQYDSYSNFHTYYFRVASYNPDGYSAWSNEDSIYVNLLLVSLQLDSPDGGEEWAAGSVQAIRWHGSVMPPSDVTIEYSLDGGSHFEPPVATNIPNARVFYWRIPETASPHCIIKVSSASNPNVYDLTDHPFRICGFSFNRGTDEGWTLAGAFDPGGGGPYPSSFFFGWKDPVNYPVTPGLDPMNNDLGSIQMFTMGSHGISPTGYDWWIMQFHSPDLSSLDCWQKANGYSVRLTDCMAVITTLYANLFVRVHDTDLEADRYFYNGDSVPLDHCIYGSENIWNDLIFDWSEIPNFPENYIVRELFVNIFGSMNGAFEGGLYLDHVMPIWQPCDFNGDVFVDGRDYSLFSRAWQTNPGDAYWSPAFDVAIPANNLVDIYDMAEFCSHWLEGK